MTKRVLCFVVYILLMTSSRLDSFSQESRTSTGIRDSTSIPDSVVFKSYEKQRLSIGVDIGYLHSTVPPGGVSDLPNCCSDFSSGSGLGFGGNLRYANVVGGALTYYIQASIGSATSKSSEIRSIGLTNLNGTAIPVEVQHNLTLSMLWMSVAPGLEYWLSEDFAVGGDFFVAYPLNVQHSQSEDLVTQNTRYSDGTRTRNAYTDRPMSGKPFFGYNVRLRYSVILSKGIRLEPSLGIQHVLSSPSDLLKSWTWISASGGLTVLCEL